MRCRFGKRFLFLAIIAAVPLCATANGRGGGWHGGAGQGGWHGAGWHGGSAWRGGIGWHGGYWHGGRAFYGAGVVWGPAYYGYYAPRVYYPAYYAPVPVYYAAPVMVVEEQVYQPYGRPTYATPQRPDAPRDSQSSLPYRTTPRSSSERIPSEAPARAKADRN